MRIKIRAADRRGQPAGTQVASGRLASGRLSSRRAGSVLGGLVLAGVLAACGTSSAPGAPGSPTAAPSTPSSQAPATSLTVSVTGVPGRQPIDWTLTCDPAGGSHPDPAGTCAALARMKNPFAPLPRGVMCPMIVTGPGAATITGTWRGQRVHVVLTRGGCDLVRWGRLSKLLGGQPPA